MGAAVSLEKEAHAEAARRYPYDAEDSEPTDATGIAQETFVAGAEWQASRPITDDQVEAACEGFYDAKDGLSRWDGIKAVNDKAWADKYRARIRAALEAERRIRS